MTLLLSQTVVALQTINGLVVSSTLILPSGCTSGRLSFPNFDQTQLSDLTKTLQVDVEFSEDGITWRHDSGSGLWQPDGTNTPPQPITTSVLPQFAGAPVRFKVQSNGLTTDLLAEIFGP